MDETRIKGQCLATLKLKNRTTVIANYVLVNSVSRNMIKNVFKRIRSFINGYGYGYKCLKRLQILSHEQIYYYLC